jgi:hypothetical protein
VSPDDLGVAYTDAIISLVRGLQLLMGAFVAFRLGQILRKRGRADGMLRGLGYGLVYIAVSAGCVELCFALLGQTSVTAAGTAAVGFFILATALAAGSVFGLWRRFDSDV